jgi:phosphoglycolate phosphatase-like HAD superfamily hydrolase
MKIVLFDIDGTLLWTNGAGRRAMEAALASHFGTPGSPTYRYDGKTDAQIVRETMRESGFSDDHISATLPSVLAEYVDRLEHELDDAADNPRVQRFHGVLELLDELDRQAERTVGLLTGNLLAGAERKLRAAGIAPERFMVGAFGSDHEDRHALPAIALKRARDLLGHPVAGEQLVIIGDTPNDLACGRAVGARAIGVATGHYSVEQLAAHQPPASAVFADLRNTAALLRAIADA